MKLVKCKDCGDSKKILIEVNSFDLEFLCTDCYHLKNSTNYFLRKQEDQDQEPSLFEKEARSGN